VGLGRGLNEAPLYSLPDQVPRGMRHAEGGGWSSLSAAYSGAGGEVGRQACA